MTTIERLAQLDVSVSTLTQSQLARVLGCSRQMIGYLLPRLTVQPYRNVGNFHDFVKLMKPSYEDEFWCQVDIRGPNDCWEWTGSRLPIPRYNYGKYYRDYSHRVVWILTHGPIPEGLEMCHSCDNPPCCNPAHLWPGTHRENVMDSVIKGRWSTSGNRGRMGYRKPPEYVRLIRAEWTGRKWGERARLAAKYHLHPVTVWHIAARHNWPEESVRA